ncbi:PAS domain-containing protein, partial [Polymorphobacter sp.]|uniref:PAS domain-containing sensor histidine kinase n=1 Tax=Polymorphobacter sp. TaxID=1909290 RepID=UPI003F71BF08
PDDLDRIIDVQKSLLSDGGPYDLEFRVKRPDGSLRWVLARGRTLLDEVGGPCGTAGVYLDITARKEGEQALARRDAQAAANERQLRTILNTMPQIVWSTQADGRHDFYNSRWYEFTGVSEMGGLGHDWVQLFHPDDQEKARQIWAHSLQTGSPYEIEMRLRRHDGVYRWILARALPIRDAEGQIERWFGTSTDIDDLKLAEEQLDMINRELSHRIRNIFAVVNSLLMLSSRGDTAHRAFADAARARIDALSRAHDYIRPDAAGANVDPSRITMHGLLHSLLSPYATPPGEGGSGTDCIVIAGDDFPIGASAATSLALVVHELATNAMKHGCLSSDGGVLRITTHVEDNVASIEWSECGGPPVRGTPVHQGFGTTLSERALKVPLAAKLQRTWHETGLIATISASVDRLAL